MPSTRSWHKVALVILSLTLHFRATADEKGPPALPPPSKGKVSFKIDVVPLLRARCFECHQGVSASSGVRLDRKDEILGKTNGRPLVALGSSAKSRLMHVVAGQVPDRVMPKKGPRLTNKQIATLRAWIDQGLDWDDSAIATPGDVDHWSFRPVQSVAVPQVRSHSWCGNPIDAFIAATYETKKLTPAPAASRRRLIRRLCLDLLGIPPTEEEIRHFEQDEAPNAYEKLADRLLASPRYGERWARHWLDIARWAESEGYESNHLRPFAWRYRDYVVQAFNRDKPFGQFIREQIAGDEIVPYSDENLIATGFLAAARLSSNEEDKYRQRNDLLVDVVNATSSAFLGLTINCAQCHNHKFDPITQRDYYRLQGFFLQGQPQDLALRDKKLWARYEAKRPADYEAAVALQRSMFESARQRLIADAKADLSPQHLKALKVRNEKRTDAEEQLAREAELKFQFTPKGIEEGILPKDRKLYGELKKKIEHVEKSMPARPQTLAYYSPVTSPHRIDVLPMLGFYPLPFEPELFAKLKPQLLIGGDVHRWGPTLDVGWPEVLGATPKAVVKSRSRFALANWIASEKNPLTARVYVNRLWQHHFGRGLVATPADFGRKGAPPTHPQLLDWLATELIRSGWSTKHVQRLIVTSSTYRRSSARNKANAKIDPDNKYLWHWKPRRLEAEVIRDVILSVSGELDLQMGGKSDAAHDTSRRRSLYLLQKRDRPTPIAALFDGPAAVLESCSRRHVSTVPLQALYLLNNEQITGLAQSLSDRVRLRAGQDRSAQIRQAFLHVLGRRPDRVERELAQRFFASNTADAGSRLKQFCQALLSLNELVYLE